MLTDVKKRPSFLKDKATQSVSALFKDQLADLVAQLDATQPHYLRCICSNYEQEDVTFNSQVVMQQLRCTGILDCVRYDVMGFRSIE